MDHQSVYSLDGLEIREKNKRPVISGRFKYNDLAVLSDRGTVRKETILPGAFDYALKDPTRDVNLLVGHSFDRPVASKLGGSLTFEDGEDFLEFIATIPEGAERATHITDLLIMLGSGLIKGISPGFRVPPKDVVPNAESLRPEPGNPGVMIRVLAQLLLYELSFVTRPAYEASQAELRSLRNLETRPTRPVRRFLP